MGQYWFKGPSGATGVYEMGKQPEGWKLWTDRPGGYEFKPGEAKEPPRSTQLGGASPTPIFGVQFIDDGQGGGYYADANGRRLNPAELAELQAAQKPAGLTFEEQMRLRQTPSVSVSYSPPDELDWAKEQREAASAAAAIRRAQEEAAREDVKLRILIEKERVAAESGRRAEEREIARDREASQYRRDQAAARVEELNTAAMNRAAEFNAQASEAAAQRQEAARATTLGAQRQNAVDIANYQQMPGDVGELGAYLAARQGEGGSPISTAIGQGENFITDRSLAPLGALLDTRAELSRPTIFSAARYDPAIIAPQQAPVPGPAPMIARAPAPPTANGLPDQAAYGAANAGALAGLSPEEYAGIPAFVKNTGPMGEALPGGIRGVQGSEENPIDPQVALAQFFAQNPGIAPPPAQAAPAAAREPMIQRAAAYTPMQVTYGAPTQPNPGARIFQRNAAAEARERSGLRGDLTPIAFSDPGTDPYLAEIAASVTAAERGVDRKLFERERQRLAPRRLPVYGRSR